MIFDKVTNGLLYLSDAWSDYSGYNGDKDETAMFVYQCKAFRNVEFSEPGRLSHGARNGDV